METEFHREMAEQGQQPCGDLNPGDLVPSTGRLFPSTSVLSLAPLWVSFQTAQAESPPKKAHPTSIQVAWTSLTNNQQLL